jgi:hypothetical protein
VKSGFIEINMYLRVRPESGKSAFLNPGYGVRGIKIPF